MYTVTCTLTTHVATSICRFFVVLFLRSCPNIFVSYFFIFFFHFSASSTMSLPAYDTPLNVHKCIRSVYGSGVMAEDDRQSSLTLLFSLRFPCTFLFYLYFTSFLFRLFILFCFFFCFLFPIVHRRLHSTFCAENASENETESTKIKAQHCMPLCLELITQPGKHCTLLCIILGNLLYTHTATHTHTHARVASRHVTSHIRMMKLKAKLGMLKCEFYWIRLD